MVDTLFLWLLVFSNNEMDSSSSTGASLLFILEYRAWKIKTWRKRKREYREEWAMPDMTNDVVRDPCSNNWPNQIS